VVVATHPSRFLAKPDPDADFWGLAWRQNYPRATVAVIRDTEKLGNQQIREIAKTLGFGWLIWPLKKAGHMICSRTFAISRIKAPPRRPGGWPVPSAELISFLILFSQRG
jgi:hypothetical protein